MSYSVLIEPADDRRVEFARWCLAQEPRIETASASGSELDSELFKQVPEHLLVGAYVDGRLYRHVEPETRQEDGETAAQAPRTTRRTRKGGIDGS
jgi:hypothetical protein